MRGLRNIYNLGVKELRSLLGDKAMLALIVFFVLLRYALGGDRPSQTTHQTLSATPVRGQR